MINIKQLPKAIFFDLDDTISSFDSVCDPAWDKCCSEFIEKYQPGYSKSELMISVHKTRDWYWSDPVRHKIGRENLKEARREVVRFALKALNDFEEKKACDLADCYTSLQDSMIALLPGSKEALEALKNLGIRMAVITNGGSDVQREKLNRFGITHYFEQIVIDSEVGFSKPDRRIFQYALDKMNIHPKDVWMVGDNLRWDVWGAKQLGIFSVWNDYKKKGMPTEPPVVPDMVVNSILEMVNKLRSIPNDSEV